MMKANHLQTFSYAAMFFLLLALVVGCGGGGSTPAIPAPVVLTGIFVDSPVSGINYTAATQSGKTNVNGEFFYLSDAIKHVKVLLKSNAATAALTGNVSQKPYERASIAAIKNLSSDGFGFNNQTEAEFSAQAKTQAEAEKVESDKIAADNKAKADKEQAERVKKNVNTVSSDMSSGEKLATIIAVNKGDVALEDVAAVLKPEGLSSGNIIRVDGKDYDINAINYGLTLPKKTIDDDHPLFLRNSKGAFDSRVDQSDEANSERERIINSHFKDARPVAMRKPVIYIMGGGGGSGKGVLLKKLQEEGVIPTKKQGAVVIDPDAIKIALKRFQDIKALGDYRAAEVVHEDSSDLSKRVLEMAKKGNSDIVFDVTFSDGLKAHARIAEFEKAGYDVKLFSVLADPIVATIRAFNRWTRSGRYVGIDIIRNAHKNFRADLDSYEVAHTSDNPEHSHRAIAESRRYENHKEIKLVSIKQYGLDRPLP